MLLLALSLSASDVHAYDVKDYLPRLPGSRSSHEDHARTAELSGVVEVPLYRSPSSSVNLVAVTALDGSEHLFEVTLGDAHMSVSEAFLGASGAEAKERNLGKGDVREVASIGFDIGEASFDDVQVQASYEGAYSGSVGLASFSDLAVAVLPSQGLIRFGGADAATEVMGSVDGATLAVRTVPSAAYKDGSRQGYSTALPMVIEGQTLGQTVDVYLHTAAGNAVVSRSVLGDLAPLRRVGTKGLYALDIDIPGMSPIHVVAEETTSTEWSFEGFDVLIGGDVTGGWDMAWDGQGRLVVAEVDAVRASSWFEKELAEAKAGLNPEPGEDGEAAPAPEGEDAAPIYAGISSVYDSYGHRAEAIEWAEKALEADGSLCSAHQAVGALKLRAGDYAGAAPHLQKAGELYAAWGDQDYEVRAALLEEKARVESGLKLFDLIPIRAPAEWEGELPQPHSCHTSWGQLAEATLALGELQSVETLWEQRRDLDAHLALVAGNAFLAQGKLGQAESAFHWSLKQSGVASAEGSLGLAMVQAASDRQAQSLANLELAYWHGDDQLGLARAYGYALGRAEGADAAAKKLGALAQAKVVGAHERLVQAELLRLAGQDDSAALKSAIAGYQRLLAGAPGLSDYSGGLSRAQQLSGDNAAAARTAQATLALDPRNTEALLVLAELAGEDATQASTFAAQARAAGAANPVFAAEAHKAASCGDKELWVSATQSCQYTGPALEQEAIEAVVRGRLDAIRGCYEGRLKRNKRLAGKLVVSFTIAQDGSVSSAEIASSELSDVKVGSCVTEQVLGMTFPAPRGAEELAVNYPFEFQP